jgi:hypothetical protein
MNVDRPGITRPAFAPPANFWRDGRAWADGRQVGGSRFFQRGRRCGGEANARPDQRPGAEEVDTTAGRGRW